MRINGMPALTYQKAKRSMSAPGTILNIGSVLHADLFNTLDRFGMKTTPAHA